MRRIFQGGFYGDSYRSTPKFLSQLHQKFPFDRVKPIGWLETAFLFDDTITGAVRTTALKNGRLIYIPIGRSIRIMRGSTKRMLHCEHRFAYLCVLIREIGKFFSKQQIE